MLWLLARCVILVTALLWASVFPSKMDTHAPLREDSVSKVLLEGLAQELFSKS